MADGSVRSASGATAHAAFLLAVWGSMCGACDSASVSVCGRGGELVTVGVARYCVYRNVASADRVTCPNGFELRLQIEDVLLCTEEEATLESLPEPVCRAAELESCGGGPPAGASLGRALLSWQSPSTASIRTLELSLREGATPTSLTDRIEAREPVGELLDDRDGTYSPDGRWLAAAMTRGPCASWTCVFLGPAADASLLEPAMLVGGDPIHRLEPAITDDGNTLVFEGGEQLEVARRASMGEPFASPSPLTAETAVPSDPRLSRDGARVLYQCPPSSGAPTAICAIGIDGSGARVVVRPDEAPPGVTVGPGTSLEQPVEAPDGSIVFGATAWDGHSIWRLAEGGAPARLLASAGDVMHPCVLPSGHVVALRGRTVVVGSPEGDVVLEIEVTLDVEDDFLFLKSCAGPPP